MQHTHHAAKEDIHMAGAFFDNGIDTEKAHQPLHNWFGDQTDNKGGNSRNEKTRDSTHASRDLSHGISPAKSPGAPGRRVASAHCAHRPVTPPDHPFARL